MKIQFTEEQINQIIDLYKQGWGMAKIGKKFGVSQTPIKRILLENNSYIINRPKYEDLTNQRFGKLVVIGLAPNYTPKSGRHAQWLCQCDCGNTVIKQSNHLKEEGENACCSLACRSRISLGTRFGSLVVLEMTDIRSQNGGAVMYKCLCDCGNIQLFSSTELRAGRRTSCTECNESKGESIIKLLLKQNNIEYIRQKTFESCKNPKTNNLLFFDFYLPKEQCLIEYDGEQHFIPIEFWGGEKGLENIQFRDKIKNDWCIKNNITLIRIPYTHLDKIKIEDLLQESKFRLENR